ncbi:MAG: imidazole glycerol phosphate synthase subunit HisH [Candidatus Altiarchaeota archaeon]|nr:imidazole glycerol phosphate synthase subunit HisH [Candidatus Altiarchaeota archaeon]
MIAVIDYGAGNLASISNGFKKIGSNVKIIDDPKLLKAADAIVLPGVGAFGDAMQELKSYRETLLDEIESGKPFLGVCLGIQLLMDSSDESQGAEGLGIFPGTCKRFKTDLKVPHMGWNTLRKTKDTPLLDGIMDGDFFYFVHSYYVVPNDAKVIAAETEYDITFPSIISQDNIHAMQFHPEKSSTKGLKILENFAKETKK